MVWVSHILCHDMHLPTVFAPSPRLLRPTSTLLSCTGTAQAGLCSHVCMQVRVYVLHPVHIQPIQSIQHCRQLVHNWCPLSVVHTGCVQHVDHSSDATYMNLSCGGAPLTVRVPLRYHRRLPHGCAEHPVLFATQQTLRMQQCTSFHLFLYIFHCL